MQGPSYGAVTLCISANALTVMIGAFFVVFYFFPHKIVFVGTGAAAASGAFWYVFNSFSVFESRFFGFRDGYIKTILSYSDSAVALSLGLLAIAVLGTAIMFRTIVDRVYYLQALDRAIPFFAADQVGLPTPKDLATAFALYPGRPEVPFILARSARLLTFDDRWNNFYLYMEQFLDALDRDSVIKRGEKFRPRFKLAQSGEAPQLPLLDPIRLLAGYMIEVSGPRQAKAYDAAIDLLAAHRNGDGDDAAKLQRTLDEIERDLDIKDYSPARKKELTIEAIARLELQTDPSKRVQSDPTAAIDAFRSVAFAADQIYQRALDQLAYLKATLVAEQAASGKPCENYEEVVALYQRVLTIRGKLMSPSEIVWWDQPGKLTLYHLFSELSGKRGYLGTLLVKQFGACPALLDGLTKLHGAAAFKAFQDPDTWTFGTALSKSFNGSAAAAQLRRWMQLGWN